MDSLKVKLGFVSQLHVQNNLAFLCGAVLLPPSSVDFALNLICLQPDVW